MFFYVHYTRGSKVKERFQCKDCVNLFFVIKIEKVINDYV